MKIELESFGCTIPDSQLWHDIFVSFFRVYILSQESGQWDWKTTKQAWQVLQVRLLTMRLVPSYLTIINSITICIYKLASLKLDRDEQTERDTSFLQKPLDGNFYVTVWSSKALFIHINPSWKILTANQTMTWSINI